MRKSQYGDQLRYNGSNEIACNGGIMRLIAVVLAVMFLSGCTSTNGWQYETDCQYHQEAHCGPCVRKMMSNEDCPRLKKNACNTCTVSPDRDHRPAPCDASYYYKCCDKRNYWME